MTISVAALWLLGHFGSFTIYLDVLIPITPIVSTTEHENRRSVAPYENAGKSFVLKFNREKNVLDFTGKMFFFLSNQVLNVIVSTIAHFAPLSPF